MKRHPIPKQNHIRVEVPVGSNWKELSLEQHRKHIFTQLKSLGSMDNQPKMKCLCGRVTPIIYAYRCYECGAFWCPKCAGKHFKD